MTVDFVIEATYKKGIRLKKNFKWFDASDTYQRILNIEELDGAVKEYTLYENYKDKRVITTVLLVEDEYLPLVIRIETASQVKRYVKLESLRKLDIDVFKFILEIIPETFFNDSNYKNNIITTLSQLYGNTDMFIEVQAFSDFMSIAEKGMDDTVSMMALEQGILALLFSGTYCREYSRKIGWYYDVLENGNFIKKIYEDDGKILIKGPEPEIEAMVEILPDIFKMDITFDRFSHPGNGSKITDVVIHMDWLHYDKEYISKLNLIRATQKNDLFKLSKLKLHNHIISIMDNYIKERYYDESGYVKLNKIGDTVEIEVSLSEHIEGGIRVSKFKYRTNLSLLTIIYNSRDSFTPILNY